MILNKAIPFKYILSLIGQEMIAVAILAGSISYFDECFSDWGLVFPLVPMTIPSLLGTMITLILGFRMNQSYERWWEARKVWGAIVNDSRALMKAVSFLGSSNKENEKESELFTEDMIKMTLGWSNALLGLLKGVNVDHRLNRFFTEEELTKFKKYDTNLANGILCAMTVKIQEALNQGLLTELQHIQCIEIINRLGDSMGKSERIKNTVFPKLYSDLISFSIWLFVILLPLAYRDPNKYFEFPIAFLISIVFFLLENIAEDLQDPFNNQPTDVPVLAITNGIEKFGISLLNDTNINLLEEEKTFFVM